MQQTTSKRGRWIQLYIDGLQRNKGLILLYTILLFLVGPLRVLLEPAPNTMYSGLMGPSDFYFSNYILPILLGCFAVLLFTLLFTRFLHEKKSTDMYFSMPISRTSLFTANLVGAITAVIIPQILIYAIYILIIKVRNLSIITVDSALTPYLYFLFTLLLFVIIIAFVSTQIGTTFDSIFVSIGVCLFPLVLYLMLQILINTYLFGVTNLAWVSLLGKFSSPAVFLLMAMRSQTSSSMVLPFIVWVLVGALIVYLSIRSVKKRKVEQIGNPAPNNWLTTTLKIFYSFIVGIFFAIIFQTFSTNEVQPIPFLLCFLLGSVLFFFIAQGILSRGFKGFKKSLKQYLVSVAAGVVLLVYLSTGGFGIVYKVPAVDGVKSVTLSFDTSNIFGSDDFSAALYSEDTYDYYGAVYTFTDKEAIEKITAAHRAYLDVYKENKTGDNYVPFQVFDPSYQLNFGTMSRRYYVSTMETNAIEELYVDILNEEVVEQIDGLFYIEGNQIQTMELTSSQFDQSINLSNEQKNHLIEALRKDRKENYADYQNAKLLGNINCMYTIPKKELADVVQDNNNNIILSNNIENASENSYYSNVSIFGCDTNTIDLLKDFGYDVTLSLDLSDIENMYVIDFYQDSQNDFSNYYGYYHADFFQGTIENYYYSSLGNGVASDSGMYVDRMVPVTEETGLTEAYKKGFDLCAQKIETDQWQSYYDNASYLPPYTNRTDNIKLLVIAPVMIDGYPDPNQVKVLQFDGE